MEIDFSGYLYKWTNYYMGFKNRWFILKNGHLSYYLDEASVNIAKKGSINLKHASLVKIDEINFQILSSSSVVYHLRSYDEKVLDKWLKLLDAVIKNLKKFDIEGENLEIKQESSYNIQLIENVHFAEKIKNILYYQETLILLTSKNIHSIKNTMENIQYKNNESNNSVEIGLKNVEELYRVHLILKKTLNDNLTQDIQPFNSPIMDKSDSNEEFFDTCSEKGDLQSVSSNRIIKTEKNSLLMPKSSFRGSLIKLNENKDKNSDPCTPIHHRSISDAFIIKTTNNVYRKTIVPRPEVKLNLWSFIKKAIGKDLSKVPMPVNFNEPLSMLQRVTEALEYSKLLDSAANSSSTLQQIAYIAAFTVSCYSSTAYRTNKPFNPILNETYEFDRLNDMGWRSICEQVTHHPPACALFAEGKNWTVLENFHVQSKFRGKYLAVLPLGLTEFNIYGSAPQKYSWNKANTTVNNIIIGTLSIDQTGSVVITNHNTKESCHLKYHQHGMFSKGFKRKVTGTIFDNTGKAVYLLNGFWDKFLDFARVLEQVDQDNYKTEEWVRLWSTNPLPENAQECYYFNEFTCSLNEMVPDIAPTDSRNRPDQRIMESGNFEEANLLKTMLEQKQRERRLKENEANTIAGIKEEAIQPVWFEKYENQSYDITVPIFKYKGGYWEHKIINKWENCPDLFSLQN